MLACKLGDRADASWLLQLGVMSRPLHETLECNRPGDLQLWPCFNKFVKKGCHTGDSETWWNRPEDIIFCCWITCFWMSLLVQGFSRSSLCTEFSHHFAHLLKTITHTLPFWPQPVLLTNDLCDWASLISFNLKPWVYVF